MVYQVTCSLYAMIVAPLLCQVIGILWFGPLFGKAWMVEMKIESYTPPVMAVVQTAVSNFVTTFIIINIQHILGVSTFQESLVIGMVYWMATIALRVSHYAYGLRTMRLFIINSAYDLAIVLTVSLSVCWLHVA